MRCGQPWDPQQKYALYQFIRQAQRFPDVILRASTPDVEPFILMGIELKGWYVLAKESEPSFRYRVTPAVCAPQDLLAVYPWALSNVISGSPQLFEPYIVSAHYAAEYRNWHWQYKKKDRGSNNEIALSSITHHYPSKADMIADVPKSDNGGNFGRFARTGLMDEYMQRLFREELSGIPLSAWQKSLAIFSEDRTEQEIAQALNRLATESTHITRLLSDETIKGLKSALIDMIRLLNPE